MVWELIEIAKHKAFRRQNMGINSFPRLNPFQSDGLCSFISDSKSIFSDLHRDLRESESKKEGFGIYDDENTGLSVVVIEESELG